MKTSPFFASIVAISATPSSAALPHRCCSDLENALPGKVYMPEESTYAARIESIFSATAALEPWCLVLPETAEDVSHTMRVIYQRKCPFGIRSGGHAVYANGNSVSMGITIDMGYMNSTTYDADTGIATVEPGARWNAVYDTLSKDGVAVVGGRVHGVGVGGLITGGGNSFHSGRYGFACDTVRAYEVVLANSTVVLATAESHADLFRGLCGGSGNLGVVTKFDMMSVPLTGGKEKPHIWGGTTKWEYENSKLVDELVSFTERAAEDDGCSVFCSWSWVNGNPNMPWSSGCALQNVDDREDAPLFDGMRNIPGALGNTFRSAPMSSFTREISGLVRNQKQNIWGSSSFKADPRVINFAIKQHKVLSTKLAERLLDDPDASALLLFQPLTLPLLSHGAYKNVLGFEEDAKGGPGMFTLVLVQAGSKKNHEIALPLVREFEKSVDDYAKQVGSFWRWTYLNYVDFFRDPIASYGPKNVQFLQRVAKEYDPGQVFQKLRVSGHKLPRT